MKIIWATKFLVLVAIPFVVTAKQDTITNKRYRLNYWIDLPITAGGWIFNHYGEIALRKKPKLDLETINSLDPMDVPGFDRIATRQDPEGAQKAHGISNKLLNASAVLPGFLFLSKKVRKEWMDVLLLYLEAQAISSTIYFSAALPIRRKRPYTYNPDEYLWRKESKKSTCSFFSGHVSATATSSFFMAKIFTDLHELKGWKRMVYYSLALIPPVTNGFYRFKAGKHFPSDLLTGLIVGGAVGILTPELHKNKDRKLTVAPISGFGMIGLNAKLVLEK